MPIHWKQTKIQRKKTAIINHEKLSKSHKSHLAPPSTGARIIFESLPLQAGSLRRVGGHQGASCVSVIDALEQNPKN